MCLLAELFCIVEVSAFAGAISDTIDVTAAIDPCASPAMAKIQVTEQKVPINWNMTATLPQQAEVPIPYLAYDIPGFAGAAVNLLVVMAGGLSALSITLGIDLCVAVPIVGKSCGPDLPVPGSPFPYELIEGTFDFSSLCALKKNRVESMVESRDLPALK